jgi:hypothetical protein
MKSSCCKAKQQNKCCFFCFFPSWVQHHKLLTAGCSDCHEKLMNSCCNRIPAASSVATGYLTYLLTYNSLSKFITKTQPQQKTTTTTTTKIPQKIHTKNSQKP